MIICKMESVLVFFSLWTLFEVQGITQKVFPQPAYRTWLDAESSCRKDRLGLLVNLDSLTKETTFDLEVSITDSDQYWTGGYRLGLFYWMYGCFTLDSAAIFMTGKFNDIGDTNSVSECTRFCGEERQWIALVKRFCYCLIDVDETALFSSRCPSPCPGDMIDSCGSDQAMSVYKMLNETEIVDDVTHQPNGDNQMCVYIIKNNTGVTRWKVDNCTQQKIVLCQNLTTSGIEFVSPHRTPKSWVAANGDCQRESMTLAVVTQNDVNKSPIDKLPSNVPVWVALRRHDLFYWTSGDIKDEPADCLAVQKDTFGNLVRSRFPCSDQFKYVCLSEREPPTVESAVIGTPAPTTSSTTETTTATSTTQPTTDKMTTKSTFQPTTKIMTTKQTTKPTTKQMTTIQTTEQMTTQPTTIPTTKQLTTMTTTIQTTEQITSKQTTIPTTITTPVQTTTQPTTVQMTSTQTTIITTRQETTQPTTKQLTTIPTTIQTTKQTTTTQLTTKQLTTIPTTIQTTEQTTTQPTTKQLTTIPTTIQTTEQTTTTQPTTKQLTTIPTTIQTTEQTTTQSTTDQLTTIPTTEQTTTQPTTQLTTEQTTTQSTTERMTNKTTTEQMTTMATTQMVTSNEIKNITPFAKFKSLLPEKSTVLPTQPIATESNAFTNTSNDLPSSGKSSEQSEHAPTTELILVILIFVALVLLGLFILVHWAVRRRKRKSLRSNRRTSKEIVFKGEDEMLIRSFSASDRTTTLSPKPMPRIDIDTGSLQVLANIPENEKKLHRSDDTLDIPWIDASMNTLDNVSVSRDTETRFDTTGTKAVSAPELDRIGVDSDEEDDVSHPNAMRTFSKQNEPILESEI